MENEKVDYCLGEKCRCGKPAVRKIEEVIFDNEDSRHPLTQYVCQEHFNEVLRPYLRKSEVLDKPDFKSKSKEYAGLISHCGPLLIEACELDFEAGCNFVFNEMVIPLRKIVQDGITVYQDDVKDLRQQITDLQEENAALQAKVKEAEEIHGIRF
jgi:hypothetical protein